MENKFRLKIHHLTYYFERLYNLCNGGKENALDNDIDDKLSQEEHRNKVKKHIDNVIKCSLSVLTDNELQCFYLFYFNDIPQERIAQLMGVSQPMVNKFIRKSIDKIKMNVITDESQLKIF